MEAFGLLKHWRRGEAKFIPANAAGTNFPDPTVEAAVTQNVVEITDDDDVNDEGHFFDLDFRILDDSRDGNDAPHKNQSESRNSPHHSEEVEDNDDDEFDCGDGEGEFKFVLSTPNNDPGDPNLALSSSDDVFFKGKLVQKEPSFLLSSSESSSKPHFTASLLKSASKFRVFISGLKKSKSNASEKETSGPDSVASKQPQTESQQPESVEKHPEQQQQQKKFYTVKFKVEVLPIMSLFNKNNSPKGDSGKKFQKQNVEQSARSAADEKRFSKETMQKYLKMAKPLYVGLSRRYDEKQGQLNVTTGGKAGPPSAAALQKPATTKSATEKLEADASDSETEGNNVMSQKRGTLPAGLRVVFKHLGRSRLASSTVAVTPSGMALSRRRDDALLQQQDGIQGAILHCKKSFNGSRECEFSQPPLSVSEPLHAILEELSEKAAEGSKEG